MIFVVFWFKSLLLLFSLVVILFCLFFRYNMIFAPFTGVDNHDKCVMFVACLLSREDVTHYTWAFDHFSKAMGRHPVVIVTDQCPAMKIAIPSSFGSKDGLFASKHRLCMWHIMQKFPIKVLLNIVFFYESCINIL